MPHRYSLKRLISLTSDSNASDIRDFFYASASRSSLLRSKMARKNLGGMETNERKDGMVQRDYEVTGMDLYAKC